MTSHPRLITLTSLCVSLSVLSACSSNNGQTLGSLKYQPEPEPLASEVAAVSHQEVRTEYQELLDLIDDKNLKEQIERRIAHVYMLEGEKDQVDGDEQVSPETSAPKSYYIEAIKSYREVLEKYPNSPDNAEVLYQLAKAYDMEGDQDEALIMLKQLTSRHPYYENIAEAHFRKGDILFNRSEYEESEQDYIAVTQHSESKYILNAHYMLGWSAYKQLHYRQAFSSFVYVLNQLLGPVESLDNLSNSDRSLTTETLHAVSLSLDKLGGAASIESLPELKDQHYVWMVYDNLGQYYLEKELFEASAETYRLFVQHHRDDDRSPSLHQKMIETYVTGSFPRQAFAEKENYVDAYGIYSSFARDRGGVTDSVKPTMQSYLDELARNYHAKGQKAQEEIAKLEKEQEEKEENDKLDIEDKTEKLDEEALVALDKAAYYYKQFIDTFPNNEKIDEYVFRQAESLFSARHFDQSIPVYERVAYEGQTPIAEEYGANAGYAAIVAYENYISELSSGDVINQWRSQAVESMLRFSEKYHQDERSPSVLTNAAEYIFSLEQYERALQIASTLIDNNPNLDSSLKKTAYGIKAHSLFKLDRFNEAGENYLLQRQLVAEDTEEHQQITERLASAIYKHSETIIAQDDKLAAIEELLKLKQLTPNSPVRITAQYDAATLLIELKSWDRAISELQELIQLYPEHDLAIEFPRKLAFSYEKNNNWSLAAKEYLQLSENDPDLELRQESLYRAATMLETDQNYLAAIEQFKAYNKLYPQPFTTAMESRFRLAENYKTLISLDPIANRDMEADKRHYWLNQIIEGNHDAGNTEQGNQRTERSEWLAAWAHSEFGDYYANGFEQQKLYLPLDKSLPEKNDWLNNATSHYQDSTDSGVFEFVTMSAYKIAALYQDFSQALRTAPKPTGLGDEEQTIYAEIINEQAQPFEELAMELHQSNVNRGWEGEFNQWIRQSFEQMSRLQPTRFAKSEIIVSYGDEIR